MTVVFNSNWERLDVPGFDSSSLLQTESGWRIEGRSEFTEGDQATNITYEIDFAANGNMWRAVIEGDAHHVVERKSKQWFLDGVLQEDITEGIGMVDFAFTPSAKYFQIKHMGLQIGESEECVVAWFDIGEREISYLHQIYTRLSTNEYEYCLPSYGYHELLTTDENGAVRDCTLLWNASSHH
jgi:hypothetical protein